MSMLTPLERVALTVARSARQATRRATRAVKAFVLRFSGYAGGWWGWNRRGRIDYAVEVGDGRGNSAVMACILWFVRAFPEAPIRVSARGRTPQQNKPIPNHPMVMLLERPNPYYSGIIMLMAMLADWLATGNGYLVKLRNQGRVPVQLWWIPQSLITPKWPDDGSVYISHYEYSPQGRPYRLEVEDVVHVRYGLDPDNPRKGLGPLASVLREIFTDDEAAAFSATLLRNLGVPGVVISPDDEDGLEPEEATEIKEQFETRFGDENRGRALVTLGKTKVTVLSFNPQQMDLKTLRRVPEERISAVFGIPAIVAGLGAGLDRSTFANYAEAREAAYESNIIPNQRLIAAELSLQLLPDFADPLREVVDFDNTQVRVLQDDQNRLYARLSQGVTAGWISVNDARLATGQKPFPNDVVYVPAARTPTLVEALGTPPEPTPALPAPRQPRDAGDTGAVIVEDETRGRRPRRHGHGPVTSPPELAHNGKGSHHLRTPLATSPRSSSNVAVPIKAATAQAFLDAQDGGVASLTVDMRPELEDAFALQGRRVLAGLPNEDALVAWPMGSPPVERRAVPDRLADADLVPDGSDAEVRRAIRAGQGAAVQRATDDVRRLLEADFEVPFELLEETRMELAGRVTGITETTREDVRRVVAAAIEEGVSMDDLRKRLRGLFTETYKNRALTIARTESATGYNLGSLMAYEASGLVERVRVHDGDGCGWGSHDSSDLADGSERTIQEARANPLAHPNCRRAFSPIVSEED